MNDIIERKSTKIILIYYLTHTATQTYIHIKSMIHIIYIGMDSMVTDGDDRHN